MACGEVEPTFNRCSSGNERHEVKGSCSKSQPGIGLEAGKYQVSTKKKQPGSVGLTKGHSADGDWSRERFEASGWLQ